jgi:hypothetical protein
MFTKILLAILIIGSVNSTSAASDLAVNSDTLLKYLTPSFIIKCDSFQMKMRGYVDSAKDAEFFKPEVKFYDYLRLKDTTYLGLILGCDGNGEFMLIDSTNRQLVRIRIPIDIPSWGANFDAQELLDINGDSIPELRFNLTAGMSGYYSCFLTLDIDNPRFIMDSRGEYEFYTMHGGIRLIKSNNSAIYDIRVDEAPAKGQSESYTIYKWNGKNYGNGEKVVKTDR